ncbi:hypothetical protein HMPREF3163_01065 [Actinomyces sp. HMSC08A01]|uniref:DeoR/GlpR family DNA-binding transcription regulator n=1 Tax=Winkia TaxID=2692118 RepID=UPI0008A565CE|nr:MULTISPECIES: DeoR/GlpR family DNA-binding transcription regulator [Winkia]OFT40305.1 hypothetical protein HMPREF3163_01065 [Actinomyces sp. HMSC08A01]PLB80052.1 DeoR/GlpR transcriptional regulator [Actinomyces sp. UMB0138]MDK6240597.1 DeoR/GlpR family DNA-binding transcription regulator [Winkia sp. UMB10116]MDU6112170.1 DeoR/GlpR family DNA-binding transcription regulator [Winkia neuii]WIK90464.1 DeoR/GlpR family DNA-binding transcription regulator [Winkia neuii]
MGSIARNQQVSAERRTQMLKLLQHEGAKAVADLVDRFGVSGQTIRRDLRVLEEKGQVLRQYGTVRAVETGSFERAWADRQETFVAEKRAIAKEAASRVGQARVVFVDEGYLPSLIPEHFPSLQGMTVVTTSLDTAKQMAALPGLTAIVAGGRVRPITGGVVDHWALQTLGQMTFDLAYMGTNGISDAGVLSTPDPAVAAVKRAALSRAKRAILVADHSKFGHCLFASFANTSDVEVVVTGKQLRAATAKRLPGAPVVRV